LLTPAQVAKKLGCSEWWIKEQARRRRIPFAWIGGTYKFTNEQVAEIIQIFEFRPVTVIGQIAPGERPTPPRLRPAKVPAGPVVRLRPRPPRRTRSRHPDEPPRSATRPT
jgi:excisionase family DNA binding protein